MTYRKTAQFREMADGGHNTAVVVLTDLASVDITKSGRWSSAVDAPKRFELPDGTPLTRVSKGVFTDPATGVTYRRLTPTVSDREPVQARRQTRVSRSRAFVGE